MPLSPGHSQSVISNNIREMIHSGHPQPQAVAASLSNARLRPGGFAFGGTPVGGFTPPQEPQKMADGGLPPMSEMAPWYTRREASAADQVHSAGLFPGSTGGRTDVLNRNVPAGAYVVPADVVSGLGEGNTMAGANILDHMMHSLPYGIQGGGGRKGGGMGIPRAPAAFKQPQINLGNMVSRGGTPKGDSGHVPIIAASGEFLIHPDQVRMLGNGNIKHGHRILDAFVLHVRKKTTKTLSKLPGPKGAKK